MNFYVKNCKVVFWCVQRKVDLLKINDDKLVPERPKYSNNGTAIIKFSKYGL